MTEVLMIPGTDCPADVSTPASRNRLAALLAACAAGKSREETEAAGLAAYHRTLERAPIAQQHALEARRERHRRHERMVERAFYVTPSFPRAAPERRPREQRHGRRHTTRGSPDDPPGSDPPDSDLNIVWREALDRFETPIEFRTLARLAMIRARRWWAA